MQSYTSLLNDSLISGDGAIDIYLVPSTYAQHYIKGDYYRYACTYRELGIDIDTAVKNAEIPTFIIEAGRNPEGEIIALPYTAEISVFLYRRSVAKEVWGTDDPATVGRIIGGGTQKWDKFTEAAKSLKKHGYCIVPGYHDLSLMIDVSLPPAAWEDLVKGNGIPPVWDEYMDVSRKLFDNGFIMDTRSWTGQWFKDLRGEGEKYSAS